MSGFDVLGYYKVLGAQPGEGEESLRRRYRDLAKIWHPDHNTSEEALENFQKLSVAYEVLKDEKRRWVYDLLSLVYSEKDYPDIENIKAYTEKNGETDVRSLVLHRTRGMLWKYSSGSCSKICGRTSALRVAAINAAANWLLGWWHPKAFLVNMQTLRSDIRNPFPVTENLRVLVHNAVAYFQAGDIRQSVRSAVLALEYADDEARCRLQDFIMAQDIRVTRPQAWNMLLLRSVQLIVPAVLVLAALLPVSSRYVTEGELWKWLNSKKEIAYYQEIDFAGRGRSVDDVVVGKILNIPVDSRDREKLYHFTEDTVLMHGPSEDFDIMKKVAAQTTVRLTGLSPDNIWARVMIDNGEMGFVRLEKLQKGIGAPIPEFSKVYSAD